MGRILGGIDRAGEEMIRRKWVIYERRSRQVMSTVYHRRKHAMFDLNQLNDYCGRRKYGVQLTKNDSETKSVLSRYPDIDLKELPIREEIKDG